jgi:hypothetical protein
MLDTLLIASALMFDGRATEAPAMPFKPSIVDSATVRTGNISMPSEGVAILTRNLVEVKAPKEIYFKGEN